MTPLWTTFGAGSIRGYGRGLGSSTINQIAYTVPGTYTFIVPTGVTTVSAVAVGAGQGNSAWAVGSTYGFAGSLSYLQSITVTPGESLTVVVGSGSAGNANGNPVLAGQQSSIARGGTVLLRARAGGAGTSIGTSSFGGESTGYAGNGAAGYAPSTSGGGTGGSAGQYAGNFATNGGNGSGGGGGGGGGPSFFNDAEVDASFISGGGGGGGVNILESGSNGIGGAGGALDVGGGGGTGGSGGTSGGAGGSYFDATGGNGGNYGGGGGLGGAYASPAAGGWIEFFSGGNGAGGAVRIIWGSNRFYPRTNTANI